MSSLRIFLSIACSACALLAHGQSSEDRVDPNGPYRSKMRILEDAAPPTVNLEDTQTGGYATALNQRAAGYAAARDGNDAAAISALREALSTDALAQVAQDELRRDLIALWARADDDAALADAHRTWQRDGAQFDALSNMLAARAYARLAQHAAALTAVDQALSDTAKPDPAWFELKVYVLVQLKRFAPAAKLAASQLSGTSGDGAAWRNLIELQRAAGDLRAATATAELAFERGVLSGADDQLVLARLYLTSGLPDHAVVLLQDAPTNSAQHLRLAVRAHLQAGDEPGALTPSRALVQLDGAPATRYALAQLEHKLGRFEDAVATLRRALRGDLGAARGRAWLLLGESYLALEKPGPARRAFEQASEIGGVYRQANAYLERLRETPSTPAEPPSAATSDATSDPSAERVAVAQTTKPPSFQRKRLPRQRFYYLSANVDSATLPTQLVSLSRRVRTGVRRERLAAAGPLQWRVDTGDVAAGGTFEVELGVPIRTRVAPRGQFRNRDLRPIDCVYVEYLGDPRELGAAWRQFLEQVAAAQLPVGGDARTVVLDARAGQGQMRFELQLELGPDEAVRTR